MQAGPVPGEQAGGQPPVPRRLRVPDRLHREPVLRKPLRGHPVQPGDLPRRGAPQLQLQQVGEQVMVTEPGTARVQRGHERVRHLQLLQHPLPARASGQGIGQRAGHPLQHAGPQQQPPHVFRLPVQHLIQQVLRHRPLTAGKLRREPARIRMPGQRQRRQPQPGRPPLGPLMQHHHRRIGQLHPGPGKQLPRLGHAEPQIPGPDLGQLTLQPQPVQPQPQVMPGTPARTAAAAAPASAAAPAAAAPPPSPEVHIIDHQPDPIFQRRQVLQQPLHHRPAVQVRRRRQLPHQPRPRSGLPQRAQHRQPRTAADPAPPAPPAPTRRCPPGPPR